MDFLKAYPFITMEQYLWELPIRMIRLMSYDATRVVYLSEKQAKKYNKKSRGKTANQITDDPKAFAAALGIPTM